MDSFLATGVGLGLRALIDSVTDDNVTASALIGIWEGVVLNHFLSKHRSSFDPYVAFGFRLFVDFMFTESFGRMTMIVMWAFLGMVFADLGGDLSKDRRFRRIWRRIRHTFPFLSRSRSRRTSRVRFIPEGSQSSMTSARSPQLPLRPTTTPFPGSFDQWSVASSEIGGPTAHEPSLREPRLRRTEPVRRETRRTESVHTLHTNRSNTLVSETLHTEITHNEPPARTPSELEYLTLPVIPDGEPSPINPSYRDGDDQPVHSGLTTPSNDLLMRNLPEDDRPIDHSGLTTPDHIHTNLMLSGTDVPPVRIISDQPEHTPTRSQLEPPAIPIRPPAERSETSLLFPEPSVPSLADLANANSQSTLTLIPPISEIPNIPTPAPDPEQPLNRDTLVEPPPQYEEPIKDVPDNVSVGGESAISGTSRTEIITKADDLRQQAQTQEKAREGYKAALDKAKREKRPWDVLWYEGEIEIAENKAKELNAKAAHRYFKAHNLKPEPQTIDVHRLQQPEAIAAVKRALRDARGAGSPELRVIVGQGKHSKNNQPVLKKAIINGLLEYSIQAKADPTNGGVLVIAIPQLTLAGVGPSTKK
ncbi:hypothetical protein BXZ70DRAFT_24725 [Cristinia sonorae]|uniref:Smr domain-containing protein n=1 Tax=Cristinia sonorae TaxID=1940300 RepID=A0A8K0XUR2_9AGAR|nr:hypothetical protein BXZ70DRAFT_24725 [Cristinia sonorae]